MKFDSRQANASGSLLYLVKMEFKIFDLINDIPREGHILKNKMMLLGVMHLPTLKSMAQNMET